MKATCLESCTRSQTQVKHSTQELPKVSSKHYTRDRRPRSVNVLYNSIMHAISSQLAYSFHNHGKSQEFFSLPLQRILQCFYSPKHSFRFPVNIPSPGGQNQECFCSTHKEKGWKATASQQLTLFIDFRTFLPKLKSGKRFNEVWRSLQLAVYISKKELLNPQPMIQAGQTTQLCFLVFHPGG